MKQNKTRQERLRVSRLEAKADATIEATERKKSPLRKFLGLFGPGFVTGASDDDPSGIGTYAQAGAALGYGLLWLTVAMLPMMAAVQYLCAKMALVSGKGLAGVIRQHFPRPVLFLAVGSVLVANTINAGADLGAIAQAIAMLTPVPANWLLVPVALAVLALQIFGSYELIAKVFKWLALALLAYIASSFLAHPDWGQVLHATVLPHITFNGQFFALVTAMLGTTISPYLFFWQSDQEIESEESKGRGAILHKPGVTSTRILKQAAADTGIGMFFSELVAYFIILGTAATLHVAGKTDIQSATQAAEALRPLAGQWASALLAVGLIGSGVLAVPVLAASASYAVCEALEWDCGIDRKWHEARKFYIVIIASTAVGVALNYMGVNPIKALVWTAVINGVMAPPLLVLIMLLTARHDVMGKRTNGFWLNAIGWFTVVVMAAAAIAMFATGGVFG